MTRTKIHVGMIQNFEIILRLNTSFKALDSSVITG